jgi:diguanylate cyclase (GGDEF)-like protein
MNRQKQSFFLISDDISLQETLRGLWPVSEVNWTIFARGSGAVEFLFNQPPDLLVIDQRVTDIPAKELVKLVKSENVYRQLPVILCLEEGDLPAMNFSEVEADDFLLRPLSPVTAKARIDLTVNRAIRELDANPLSKLPGNTSIINRIQDLIDRQEEFALAYVDLDHFKSFNDKYGFSRGDEVLLMTARVIVNTIRSFVGVNGFVGHVGGDDYVFVLAPESVEAACQRIIENFDSIIPHFYDPEDRKLGKIVSVDRQNHRQEYPLMAVSIGVVFNTKGSLKHYGEASQTAMNLKKKAKENPKSSYVLDRRQTS